MILQQQQSSSGEVIGDIGMSMIAHIVSNV